MQEESHENLKYTSHYEGSLVTLAATQGGCQKRVIVCVLYDADDRVVSIGTNRCNPPESGCPRLGIAYLDKSNYPQPTCNTIHAEVDALSKLPANETAVRAVVYGHEFVCSSCEEILKEYGITNIKIVPDGFGTGLR